MKGYAKLKGILRKGLTPVRIIIAVGIGIGIFRLLRFMGLLGILSFASGMAVMAAVVIHPWTSPMVMFLVKACSGDESLLKYLKGGNDEIKIKVGKR